MDKLFFDSILFSDGTVFKKASILVVSNHKLRHLAGARVAAVMDGFANGAAISEKKTACAFT